MQIFYNKTTLMDTIMIIIDQIETTKIIKNGDCVQLWHHDKVIGYNILNASDSFSDFLTTKNLELNDIQIGAYADHCLLPLTKQFGCAIKNHLSANGFNIDFEGMIPKLVVGKIVNCQKHPHSEKLQICNVDVKDEILSIVCGATNARENILVVVALDGAILYNGVQIKNGTVLKVASAGMLCSARELGIKVPNEVSGILELDQNKFEIGQEFKIFGI